MFITTSACCKAQGEEIPQASGVTRIAQQVGAALGTAIPTTQTAAHTGVSGRPGAFDTAVWWSLSLAAIAVIPALALPHTPERTSPTEPPPTTQPATGAVAGAASTNGGVIKRAPA